MIVKVFEANGAKKLKGYHFGEKNLDSAIAHIKYVGFRSREIGDERGFFSEKDNHSDYKAFIDRIKTNKALQHSSTVKIHKLVIALEKKEYDIYKHSGKDLKDIVRSTMKSYEIEKDLKLDWVANIHHENGKNPHAHIVIKGVSDNKGDRGNTQRVKIGVYSARDMRIMAKDHIDKYIDKEYAKEYYRDYYKKNPSESRFKNYFEKEKNINYFEKKNVIEKDITKATENIFKKFAQDIKKETGKAENQNQRDNKNKLQRKINKQDEINKINKKERER